MKVQNGFTLIEILITITIMGILAGASYTNYQSYVQKSRDSRRKVDLEQIRGALELYRSNTTDGVYPTTIEYNDDILVTQKYLASTPVDPLSRDSTIIPYGYEALPLNCTNTADDYCTSYQLSAVLESQGQITYLLYPTKDGSFTPTPTTP